MSSKPKAFEDVMFNLKRKARSHVGNFSLVEYAENVGVETLLNYAWKARGELAKEREAEVLKMVDLFINKEKSRITDSVSGCTRMEAEYAIKMLRKMKQEIEALLNGEGDG